MYYLIRAIAPDNRKISMLTDFKKNTHYITMKTKLRTTV